MIAYKGLFFLGKEELKKKEKKILHFASFHGRYINTKHTHIELLNEHYGVVLHPRGTNDRRGADARRLSVSVR